MRLPLMRLTYGPWFDLWSVGPFRSLGLGQIFRSSELHILDMNDGSTTRTVTRSTVRGYPSVVSYLAS
uniref:Putative ovule protein n=1 Tax=Solanum chacoense TaxID=4108 RepID=A0A0V0GT17_SOLCH